MKRKPHRLWAFAMTGSEIFFAVVCFGRVELGDLAAVSEADSSRPYAKVCLAVLDQNEGSEVAFTPELEPGPGKSIVAHAVASAPCVLFVAAFYQGNGQLANDWRPQFKELNEEWDEVTLPGKKTTWRWEEKVEPLDFYILFLSPSSVFARELKDLAGAMQDANSTGGILKLQTNKLHELISGAAGDSDPSKHRATATVTEIHGVTRGQKEFPWRSFASKVYFDDQNSGLLVFPTNQLR
ncbi:MAG: hypothetical protein JO313_13135 [Verrucomicrobia bacterium]|nr:hypothetical protein [Verrucomicrobiota bacterium]